MRCSYCFYRDVADHRAHAVRELMSEETVRALVDRALGLGSDAQVTFAFQGGEPTLAGLDFFRSFTAYVDERRTGQTVSYALQTNGHSLTPEWAAFFREHGFLVGVSVDAYRELHDSLRGDIRLEPTHARAMESIRMLREAGVEFNVLTVLSAQLPGTRSGCSSSTSARRSTTCSSSPASVSTWISISEGEEYALTPRAFFSFYRTFFDLWLREARAGRAFSVGLFDNVMQLSLGQWPQACGMLGRCAPQFVVESNGDVYPCDFYVLDQWRMGSVTEDGYDALLQAPAARRFLAEPRRECAACADCPFEGICHRNCKRLNASYYDETYCGYREFLEHAYRPLAEMARALVRQRIGQ